MKRCAFLLACCLLASLACTADEIVYNQPDTATVKVYWTSTPPVLDGKMDDACWKDADAAKAFGLFKHTGLPSQKTEVYMRYDADNLYLFWKLHEDQMGKLVFGPQEDARDMLEWSDTAEMFFDPSGDAEKTFFQMCASPLGTRYDRAHKLGQAFNPFWTVVPGIHDWGWTLEIAIPFTEMTVPGESMGTPNPGDFWRLNFARDEGASHEWTEWVATLKSHGERRFYGKAVFMRRDDQAAVPVVRLASTNLLAYGPGAIEFTTDGSAKASGDYELLHNGQSTGKTALRAGERIVVPFHITSAGTWDLRVTFQDGDKPFLTWRTMTTLSPVREPLEEILQRTAQAMKRLGTFKHPVGEKLRGRVRALADDAAKSRAKLGALESLSQKDWRMLGEDSAVLRKAWDEIGFDVHLVNLFPETGTPAAFALGVAGPDEKVARKALYEGSLDAPVKLAVAGNERESFQLIVIPFWETITNVCVSFSDLSGANGRIPAENLSFARVDYVRQGAESETYTPDILAPPELASSVVQAGQVQPIWIDVYVPKNTPPGDYKGTVTVQAGGQALSRDIEAHVFGFSIPDKHSLENNFWYNQWTWRYYFGHAVPYSLELHEAHARVLSRYRATSTIGDWTIMEPNITIYLEPDGHITFDLSKWEAHIELAKKYHASSYWASGGCNTAALTWLSRGKMIDRRTGDKIDIAEFIKGKDPNPLYAAYLPQLVEALKRVGFLDVSYWELYDEPNDNSRWLQMLKAHRWYRKVAPELRLLNFGVEPLREASGGKALGLIDCWAPNLVGLTEEMLAAMRERRAKYGEKYWFYTCSARSDKDGDFTPFITYDQPLLASRVHAWMAWCFKADGMLIYAMSGISKAMHNRPLAERWP
ncbi:MAG: DUF6067 family protein, partial [Kiritimatiellae bacterium]|nr:DUF6067 family protein [Kiritimatiellia bacterium]